jgi:mercuric ion binding protein
MKTVLLTLTLALAAVSFTAIGADRTVTLTVENMSCVTCPITVKTALKRVPGVREATVDFKTKLAVVSFDETKTNAKALVKASTDIGFPASVK